MAALNAIAKEWADEIRDGIAWVIIWKTGRSWNGYAAWLDPDTDTFEPDDLEKAREILAEDPNAVMLNGYYCGHFGEDMTVAEIAAGIRWHYENGYNLLSDSTALPDEPEVAPATTQKPENSMELALTIGPEQADAIVKRAAEIIRPAIDYAAQKAQEFMDWAFQTAGALAKFAAEAASKFMDALLYSANTHPKWWHLYKYAKKRRTRKKYRRRLMKQLNMKLATAET